MGSATNLHWTCPMRADDGVRWIPHSFSTSLPTRRLSAGGRPNLCAVAGGSPPASSLPREGIKPPWLMLAPTTDESGNPAYEFYSLAKKTSLFRLQKSRHGEAGPNPPPGDCTILGSAHGWLILSDFHSSDLYLSDPISHRHIKLPSLKSFSGEMRVILTSSPDDHDSLVILSFLPEHRLVYCSPGRSGAWAPMAPSKSDEIINVRETNLYKEFAYSRGRKLLFCLTDWFIDVWDLAFTGNPKVDWMAEALQIEPQPGRSQQVSELKQKFYRRDWILKYLILDQGSEELFLVARYVNPRMGSDGSYVKDIFFSKYRGWDSSYPYKTIDFEVMFVGKGYSFAVLASDHPELNPDSVYFVDDDELSYGKHMWTEEETATEIVWTDYGGHDNGIFDYEKKSFSSLCDLCPFDYQSITRISPPPLWFAPPPKLR